MSVLEKFNNLNNTEVTREIIQDIIADAKTENQTEIVYRLSKILIENPNSQEFFIELEQYPTSLNAPRHKGAFKDALTECGRLKKGWRFEKGSVIKVVKNAPKKKVSKTQSKTTQKKPLNNKVHSYKAFKADVTNSINVIRKNTDKLNKISDELQQYLNDAELNKSIKAKNLDKSYNYLDKEISKSIKILSEVCKCSEDQIIYVVFDLFLTKTEFEKWLKQTYRNKYGTPKQLQFALNGKQLNVKTEKFKNMSVRELRAFTLKYFNEHLKGKKIEIVNSVKEVVFVSNAGRKILKPIYVEKVAVIEQLEQIIKKSTYNNWGDRKSNDSPDVLGYLNFKSKLIIDGKKRHVRVSVVLDRNRKTKLKSYDVGTRPKKNNSPYSETRRLLRAESKLQTKDTKTNQKPQNNTLNALVITPQIEKAPILRKNSLAYKLANRSNRKVEYYDINDKDLADFLGKIERKEKESVVITVTGGQGSMKTRFAFRFMNALAQKYKVGHASIEEHPESTLYWNKVHEYISEQALHNINNPEVDNLSTLDDLIKSNDVIIIDSFAKMQELEKGFEVDKDLRKKYDGKLFLVIFQQTADGKMRGGTKSQYDADIVLFTEKFDNYENNFVYADKNRYQNKTLCELQYNIYRGQLNDLKPIKEEEEKELV